MLTRRNDAQKNAHSTFDDGRDILTPYDNNSDERREVCCGGKQKEMWIRCFSNHEHANFETSVNTDQLEYIILNRKDKTVCFRSNRGDGYIECIDDRASYGCFTEIMDSIHEGKNAFDARRYQDSAYKFVNRYVDIPKNRK